MRNEFYVKGMMCGGCAKNVENALKRIDGVENVVINLADHKVVLDSKEEISEEVLVNAIKKAGYTYSKESF